MRSSSRGLREVLGDPPAVALLRSITIGHFVGADWLGIELRRLQADGLVRALPGRRLALTPRGRMLLEVANGESACPLDER
jgi:hypothetical protein